MRDPTVALYVLATLTTLVGVWWVSRTRGNRAGLATLGALLVASALAVLAFPAYASSYRDKNVQFAFVASVLATLGVILVMGRLQTRPLERVLARLGARPRLAAAALAAVAVVVALASVEFAAASLVRAGVLRRYTPTETRVAQATEDWRLSHITSDEYREPDPVLLWRPIAGPPYTPQRFRGPVVATRASNASLRVICYGDSNTDGPSEGGAWPDHVAATIAARGRVPSAQIEVLNAGVTGYSSYQGRRRIEQELDMYRPDVVVVSFGWNDAAISISVEDKAFAESDTFRQIDPRTVAVRRALFAYDAARVAARYLTPGRTEIQAVSGSFGPRVTLEDYRLNLEGIVAKAAADGAQVVLMTRPHRDPEAALAQAPGWRARVPAYTAVTRQVAAERQVPLVDAQRLFDGHHESFLDESHLTREGHRQLADAVVEALDAAGFLRLR